MSVRRRLARWLVGPYLNLPERKGVWVVQRYDDEGRTVVVVEADKFRLRLQTRLRSFDEPFDLSDFGKPRSTGRFVGTVRSPETYKAGRGATGALDRARLRRALDLCGIGLIDGHPASDWTEALADEYDLPGAEALNVGRKVGLAGTWLDFDR